MEKTPLQNQQFISASNIGTKMLITGRETVAF